MTNFVAIANQHDIASAPTSIMMDVMTVDTYEIAEHIAVMRVQEESDAYRCTDYLAGNDQAVSEQQQPQSSAGQRPQQFTGRPIDAECRRKMVEWCSQVVDFCKFSRETVSVAMSFLDRFLSAHETDARAASARKSRKEYQLAAMTALYVAVKLNEPLEMDTALVSELSRGCYTAVEVAEMERDMLSALRWRTSGPTALAFLRHFLALLPPSVQVRCPDAAEALLDFGRFQTELAASDYAYVALNPSSVAIAALLNSMEAVEGTLLRRERAAFLRNVKHAAGLSSVRSDEIELARARLLQAFVRSSGYDFRQAAACFQPEFTTAVQEPELSSEGNCEKQQKMRCSLGGGQASPVCVSE